jgi:riboflavin biosynthesis pyrimidine reductase
MSPEQGGDLVTYCDLDFPPASDQRPYAYINMVATIDGKILSGSRSEHVLDLGSKVDHILMKRIERSADAIIVGAQTLRVNPSTWKPHPRIRIVVSASGDLPYDSEFLKGGQSYLVAPTEAKLPPLNGIEVIRSGTQRVEFAPVFDCFRNKLGIQRLLVLGGSELNAQLLAANLIDELFVTIAPKVRLGRDVPTYADGEPLSRGNLQQYSLVENHAIGNEIFIRYRRD